MKAKKEVYFGKHAQEKIVEFVNAKTEAEKTLIYNNFLQKPLAKLCENIINYERFNFKEIDSYGNLHNELMSHLYSILHKYNPKRKSKIYKGQTSSAFSFLQTCAKNYLVQLSIEKKKSIFLNDKKEEDKYVQILDNLEDNTTEETINNETKEFVEVLKNTFKKRFERNVYDGNKKKIADALIYLLENSNNINIYSKKHLYLLVKEYTNLDAKKITKFLNEFKEDYIKIRTNYYNYKI